ncbi:MAG: hypothetical protein K2X82_18285 [Gemmataceae bacterium]|nr:hypothetical protein [Gemmataceae bacterium]
MNARSLLSPWKVLVAAVAIGAASTPAQAGLTLTGTTGSETKNSTNDAMGGATFGTKTYGNSLVFTDYTLYYNISETPPGSSTPTTTRTVTLDGRLVSQHKVLGNIQFTLLSTNDTTPQGKPFVVGATLATTYNPTMIGGEPANGPGDSVSTFGQVVQGSNTSKSGSSPISLTYDVNNLSKSGSQQQSHNAPLTGAFDLAGLTTNFDINDYHATDVTFVATAYVHAVPEPVSILAAAFGLPCMGAVVRFGRRKLGRATA